VTDPAAPAARRRGVRIVILVALALAGCAEPRAVDEPPSGFVPPTHRDGDRVVMPLTFPDGTRISIAYPPELALAELGVVPYGSATLQGESPHPERGDEVGRDFLVRYGAGESRPRSLDFAFGPWTVEVYDYAADSPAAMTRRERESFHAALSGHVTGDGFLVLTAAPPLELAEAGEHAGPALKFGTPADRWVRLALERCGPAAETTGPPGFVAWCLSDSIVAHAEGGRRFLAAAAEGIELR